MSPRHRRCAPAGFWYHVVNRGVNRQRIFHKEADFERFLVRVRQAAARYPVECAAYCVMPNHFHLVLRPLEDHALSAYMRFLCSRSACDLRSNTHTIGLGHVYQSRFWNGAVEDEWHMLLLIRYVEGNAVRAGLVGQAEEWPWGSLWERTVRGRRILSASPVALPDEWASIVNDGCTLQELERLRSQPISVQSGR